MKIILLTSDYHISANIGIKAFLDHPGLKKHDFEIAGIIVADQFSLKAKSLKRTAHYFRKLKFTFLIKQILTNVFKQIKIFIARHFFRNRKRSYYSIEEMAEKKDVPFLATDSVNSVEAEQFIREKKPDLLASCFLLEVVKKRILDLPEKGAVNVHPALIQNHRGIFSSFWALVKNWKKTGATVHYMTEKIDEGDVILQKHFFIHPSDTMHAINKKAAKLGGKLLAKAIINIKKSKVRKRRLKKLGQMFSTPKPVDIKNFYAKGKRLISLKEFFTL